MMQLAFQRMLCRKKSSLLVFLVLFISFSFAILSLSLTGSISKTNAEFRLNTYGEWYFSIPSGIEEDAEWLTKQTWTEAVGTAGNYGEIVTTSRAFAFGTLDETLLEIGRISLDAGRFPETDTEIMMEADVLSALGYDYTLGQEIICLVQVPVGETTIPVERIFTLCGILREYSDLWMLERNEENRKLVSAIVTPSAAEQVLVEARACLEKENENLIACIPQYFISVAEENWEEAFTAIRQWMADSRTDSADILPGRNKTAYPGGIEKPSDTFYIGIIALITMVAVLCVYVMQFPGEIHSFAVLRSVGMTKLQLGLMLVWETLFLSVPAILLGIPCGGGLTWLGLRLMMYSGSVPIQVSIPYESLGTVIFLWIAAVIFSRLLVFLVTVRMPLTGRMQLAGGRGRGVRLLRNGLIILLLGCFGVAVVYTGCESLSPAFRRKTWSLYPSYTISDSTTKHTVSETKVDLIRQIPGVARVDGFGESEIGLRFPGMEETTVWLYAIDESGWEETFSFGENRQAFHDGELIFLCMPKEDKTTYMLPEDEVTLSVYNLAGEYVTERTTPVCMMEISENTLNRLLAYIFEPYTVICSEKYLKELLAAMPEGERWDRYTAGEEFGYDRVYAMADLNSEDLSTDTAVAEFCAEHALFLDNRRQEFLAQVQEYVQTLILLYSLGGCIGLVVLLILASALALETEQESRSFAMLRAIGMSRRQMRKKIWGKAFARSFLALSVGWVLYGMYAVAGRMTGGMDAAEAVNSVILMIRFNGGDLLWGIALSGFCLLVSLIVSLVMKRKLVSSKEYWSL